MDTVFRTCTICEASCGLAFQREAGELVAVRPDEDDVLSRGYVCPKGIAYLELLRDPDRLRQPVRRTASGDFEPIAWDEALRFAADGLARVRAEHGANAVAIYWGNPIVHNPGALLLRAGLMRALGTRNSYSAGTQDTSPRFATSYHLYGGSFIAPLPDLARTDYLLCLGANPVVSNGSALTAPDMKSRLRDIRARGGRVVVVDPRRSETAREADEHVPILPGGDAALLLAMVRVLVDEGRVDRARVDALARGFGAVEAELRALDLDTLADECGIPVGTIARLAREFADAPTSTAYSRIGVCNNRYGTLGTYATDLLNLAAGRLGALGGAVFARPALDVSRVMKLPGMDGHARWRTRLRKLPETLGDLPSACLAEEMETPGKGQIRAFVTYAGNPVLSAPNGRRIGRALERLDFRVSIDFYVNETTRHADVILPPAGPLAEEHVDLIFPSFMVRNVARYSPAAVEKRADERHDWEILRGLAEALGGGMTGYPLVDRALRLVRKLGFDLTPLHLLDGLLRTGPHRLSVAKLKKAPHGIDLGPLRAGVADRVVHADRKVHVDAPPLLEALRAFVRRPVSESRREPGTLLLVGRREVRSNNSWLHNLPSLVSGRERCVLYVHPDDAKAAGLADGESAWLESRVHGGAVPIRISDEMRPGVASLPHGYGHAEAARFQRTAGRRPGVSFNDWADDAEVESVVGQSILNGVPVRLRQL
jgi:anaerobic selenocysteine-containing dehydrogenase